MRQSQSAVLERGQSFDRRHATEPFEVAWASEARWFVHFLEGSAATSVTLQVQISPDGINWIDHESAPVVAAAHGFVSIPVERFGMWLRLTTTRLEGEDDLVLRIYLQLKE